MPTRRELDRREKQRRGEDPAFPDALADSGGNDEATGQGTSPPAEPGAETNPAYNLNPKDAYAGRADQDVTSNTGTGAGGATEWGGGNKHHPSRIASKPPGNS